MQVLVLWSHPSGYFHACLNQLAARSSVTALFLRPDQDAPFKLDSFSDALYTSVWLPAHQRFEFIRSWTQSVDFNPEICLVSGWHHQFYNAVLGKLLPKACIRVLCFDWSWEPTLRNRIKALYGLLYKSRAYDWAFVPGERQYQFALRVGFPPDRICQGLYSADHSLFEAHSWNDRHNRVVFVARLVPSKGCEDLIAAWRMFQEAFQESSQWSLHVYGVGPFETHFASLPNCFVHSFLQPVQLSAELLKAKILVAPSLYEPWGVQIHEACCAGLAIISTYNCGSVPHLVRTGFNGFLVPKASPHELARALVTLVSLEEDITRPLSILGYNSRELSKQFTGQIFSDALQSIIMPLAESLPWCKT